MIPIADGVEGNEVFRPVWVAAQLCLVADNDLLSGKMVAKNVVTGSQHSNLGLCQWELEPNVLIVPRPGRPQHPWPEFFQ